MTKGYLDHWKFRGPLCQISVAVLDSGVDSSHSLLRRRVVRCQRYRFLSDCISSQRMSIQRNNDCNGHGTGVASIITSLAPNVSVQDFVVLESDCRGDSRIVMRALEDAIDSDAQIINLSLVVMQRGNARRMKQLIERARTRNKIIVAAAKNDGTGAAGGFPAECEGVLGVGVGAFDGLQVHTSSRRKGIDCLATGDLLFTAHPGGGFIRQSGSSFATAVVSALCALCKGVDPDLTIDDIRQLIRNGIAGGHGVWRRNPLEVAEENCVDAVQKVKYKCANCGSERCVSDAFPRVRCLNCGLVGRRKPLLDSRLYFNVLRELADADSVDGGDRCQRTHDAVMCRYKSICSSKTCSRLTARSCLAVDLLHDYMLLHKKTDFLSACGYTSAECNRILLLNARRSMAK